MKVDLQMESFSRITLGPAFLVLGPNYGTMSRFLGFLRVSLESRFSGFHRVSLGSRVPVFRVFAGFRQGPTRVPGLGFPVCQSKIIYGHTEYGPLLINKEPSFCPSVEAFFNIEEKINFSHNRSSLLLILKQIQFQRYGKQPFTNTEKNAVLCETQAGYF